MDFKDLFSKHADDYARFRPRYPADLFAWLARIAPGRELALDVGAGNGQAAAELGRHFEKVIAVEPSADQIASAQPAMHVVFRQGTAESLGVDTGTADLLVAAQAFHWFKRQPFFAEVRRVLRPSGCLAVWCYGLGTITPEIDGLVHELYETRLGNFWEPERKLVEDGYRAVEFPFAEIQVPPFDMSLSWSFEHLLGYLGTWSALKRCMRERGENPLASMLPRLQRAWGNAGERQVTWPLKVRAFRSSGAEV
jgi:SAM-dependent methyltransferase